MNSVTMAPVSFLDLKPSTDVLCREYGSGLRRSPKRLPSKCFYDREGSALFDRICELPEYYLSRAEQSILERHVDEIAGIIGARCFLIELGSGGSMKTRLLLDRLNSPAGYVPIELTRRHLIQSVQRLAQQYPHLPILPLCLDYTQEFQLPVPLIAPRRTVFFFPGSTVGNLEPRDAESFLRRLWSMAGASGGLLIGVDLKKGIDLLEAAYNDHHGVTAAFNRNMLARANRELGADFELSRFEHLAFYNESEGRIEMHLVSLDQQHVHLGGELIWFADGESITTEYSYKYHTEEFEALARRAGWTPTALWVDDANLFSLHYLSAN